MSLDTLFEGMPTTSIPLPSQGFSFEPFKPTTFPYTDFLPTPVSTFTTHPKELVSSASYTQATEVPTEPRTSTETTPPDVDKEESFRATKRDATVSVLKSLCLSAITRKPANTSKTISMK